MGTPEQRSHVGVVMVKVQKSKDAMAKKGKKKWSKTKSRDKVENASLFTQEVLDKFRKEIPKVKLITPSIVSDRLKIKLSLARRALKDLLAEGRIRLVSAHGSQLIYTRATAAVAADDNDDDSEDD